MKNKEVVEDSLNFCKDIKYYEADDNTFLFDSKNYPNLKEYINWVDHTDADISKDYNNYEEVLSLAEKQPETLDNTVSAASILYEKYYKDDYVPDIENMMADEIDSTAEEEKPRFTLKNVLSFLVELLVCVAISIVIVFGVSTFVVTHTKVIGHSMEDTLHDGEYLFINRLTYQFQDPKQFDIIVFKHSDNEKYIKRVIACPGQTVQIKDGTIYVDNEVVNENYGKDTINDPGMAANPITLGEDEYFVLGDNRNNSSDSRSSSVGLIHRDTIQGKVLLRFWPLNQFGTVD